MRPKLLLHVVTSTLVLAAALMLPATSGAAPKYKILHTFTGAADGGLVATTPVLDATGNVYGTTYWGGVGGPCGYQTGCGVIFRLSPEANGHWREKVLLDFTDDTGGASWQFPLLFDDSGNLFGSTSALDYKAYTFELTPGRPEWNFIPIYDAGGGCLVFDQSGNLYGCIGQGRYGHGAFGELSPGSNGWTYTDIYDFCPPPQYCESGLEPESPLAWDVIGNLYGTMTAGGGQCDCGVAFQMTPNGDGTWTYHVLHHFGVRKTDGTYPDAGLAVDAAGNAYGLTSAGGKYGTGTFYKLTPTKSGPWKETILYEFPNCNDGCGPSWTLVSDQAGNLYSSGAGGLDCGGISCGTVFKFTPQKNGTWKYSVIHEFNGNDGAFPYGVVLDDKGDIFGTTMRGGKYNMGVAFEITP